MMEAIGRQSAPSLSRLSSDNTRATVPHPSGGVRHWLSTPHRLWLEALVLIALYVTYDAGRGLAGGGRALAIRHGREVAHLEAHLGFFVENDLQHIAGHVPHLDGLLGFGYSTFHLGATVIVLGWLYRRRRQVFAPARTALILATGLALVGFTFFPAAPPRLDGVGVADTLSLGRATSQSGLLRVLYNPYAAMPSVHMAFAVLVGSWIARYGTARWSKALGWGYPLFVAFEVVATGNHFLLDVAAGAVVAGLATAGTSRLLALRPTQTVTLLPCCDASPTSLRPVTDLSDRRAS